jgi:uncharacterized protein YodC (DUF2158 family)
MVIAVLNPSYALGEPLMTDLKIGEVVTLKSGGHKMSVLEITQDAAKCIWSDGKRVRSESFHPTLLIAQGAPITRIERLILFPDKDI